MSIENIKLNTNVEFPKDLISLNSNNLPFLKTALEWNNEIYGEIKNLPKLFNNAKDTNLVEYAIMSTESNIINKLISKIV